MTREKLKFNEDMKQYVPPSQLWSADWGGEMDFEYDHATYWPALNDMCDKRREEKRRRWVAAGKVVGESEVYLAGGTDVSAEGVKYDASAAAAAADTSTTVEGGKDKKDGEGVDGVEEKLAAATLEEAGSKPAAAAAA